MMSTFTSAVFFLLMSTVSKGSDSLHTVRMTSHHIRNSFDLLETLMMDNDHIDVRTYSRLTLSVRAVVSVVGPETRSKRPGRPQLLRRRKRDILDELTYSILEYDGQKSPEVQDTRSLLQVTPVPSSPETSTQAPQGSLAANSSKFEKKKSSAAAITLVVIVTVLLKLIGVTLFCKHVLVRYNNKKRERQKREALERLQRSQNELMQSYIAANNQRQKKVIEKTLSEISRMEEPRQKPCKVKSSKSKSVEKLSGSNLHLAGRLHRAEAWRSLDGLVRLSDLTVEESYPRRLSHSLEDSHLPTSSPLVYTAHSGHRGIVSDVPTVISPPPLQRPRCWSMCSVASRDKRVVDPYQKHLTSGQGTHVSSHGLGVVGSDRACRQEVYTHILKEPPPRSTYPELSETWKLEESSVDSDATERSQLLPLDILGRDTHYGLLDSTDRNRPTPWPSLHQGKPRSMSIPSSFSQTSLKSSITDTLMNRPTHRYSACTSVTGKIHHSEGFPNSSTSFHNDGGRLGRRKNSVCSIVQKEHELIGLRHVTIESHASEERVLVKPSSSPSMPPPPPNATPRRGSGSYASRRLSSVGISLEFMSTKNCSRL